MYNEQEWRTIASTNTGDKRVWIEMRKDRTRVRYTLDVDWSYAGQSTIKVELWTSTSGWAEVMRFTGSDASIKALIIRAAQPKGPTHETVLDTLRDQYLRPALDLFTA